MASLLPVWIHVLSAFYWVGGMLFLALVFVPVYRAESNQPQAYGFFQKVARRFRKGGWIAILLLLISGVMLLSQHISLKKPVQEWPAVLQTKLCVVALLVALAALHDLFVGPRIGVLRKKPRDAFTWGERMVFRLSPWLASGVLVLGVIVVCVGTSISRG